MSKVTLDMNTFKALASDTRLNILKSLDGKKLSLNDICKETKLNKATLHEHLGKLADVGLIRRNERDGHKWVYYNLTWKGECLLHPENARIVVLFSITFLALSAGIIQIISYIKSKITSISPFGSDKTLNFMQEFGTEDGADLVVGSERSIIPPESVLLDKGGEYGATHNVVVGTTSQVHDPVFMYIAIACLIIFSVMLGFFVWRYRKNKNIKI